MYICTTIVRLVLSENHDLVFVLCCLQLEGSESRSGSSLSLKQMHVTPHRGNSEHNANTSSQSPSHQGVIKVQRSVSATNPQKSRRYSSGGENKGQLAALAAAKFDKFEHTVSEFVVT